MRYIIEELEESVIEFARQELEEIYAQKSKLSHTDDEVSETHDDVSENQSDPEPKPKARAFWRLWW